MIITLPRVLFRKICFNIRSTSLENLYLKHVFRSHLFKCYSSTETQKLVNCNVGTIGHIDHGKTTLTAAITKYASLKGRSKYVPYEKIDQAPQERARGITINIAHVGYQTLKRRYSHTDCPGHADFIKNMIAGTSQMDCAILVVAATDGQMPQTREHLNLAKKIGLEDLIVYINKVDLVDREIVELVELELRDLLSEYGFNENNIPVISGSAKLALEGDKSEIGEPSIQKLLDALDEHITVPGRDTKSPFYLPIDNALLVEGRGTVVVGTIKRGTIKKKNTGLLMGFNEAHRATVSEIQMFHKPVDEAIAGDNVGLLMRGLKLKDVRRGMTFCAEKSINLTNHFEAELYLSSQDEDGRDKPLVSKFIELICCETWFSLARIDLPKEIDMLLPGESSKVKITTLYKFPLLPGQRFTLRESKKFNTGYGIITKVISATPETLTSERLKRMLIPDS